MNYFEDIMLWVTVVFGDAQIRHRLNCTMNWSKSTKTEFNENKKNNISSISHKNCHWEFPLWRSG